MIGQGTEKSRGFREPERERPSALDASEELADCPGCSATLIERYGYLVRNYRITSGGKCPSCSTGIPGIWPEHGAGEVRMGEGMAA